MRESQAGNVEMSGNYASFATMHTSIIGHNEDTGSKRTCNPLDDKRHGQKPPPPMMCEVDMPMDTAGFKEPPETLPMAKPPTVAHIQIAKPKYS